MVKDTSANAKKALNNYLTLVKQDPKYLWKDPTTKIALVDLLLTSWSLNSITDKDSIAKLLLQKHSAINQLQQNPETTKITLVEQAKKYISVIFEHPIWKMILWFLDDILWGKGGLKKLLWWEGSYFAQELDRQFAKEYGLSRQQKKTLESIDNYLKSDSKPNPNKPDGTPKTAEEIKEEIGKEPINILSAIDEPQKNLDVNVFHAYFRTLKPSNNYIYDDFFSADNNWKPIFKENIERDKLASLITDIINYQPEEWKTPQSLLSIATQTNSFIKAKQEKSSSYFWAKENITPYDPVLYSMMYLMAWSKGQGKFHYVVTENPIENLENKKSDFDILKDNLLSNINTIKDNKYNDKDISQYKVDSNSKYQTDILTKMKNIFTTKPENDKKPSYFEQILQDKGSLTFILWEKNIHLKNMLTLLWSEKDSGFSVDPKIIEAISTLTTIESDGKILTLSSSEQNNKSKITLSFDKDKTPSLEIKPSWGEAQQPEEQESSAWNQNQTESVPTESNV